MDKRKWNQEKCEYTFCPLSFLPWPLKTSGDEAPGLPNTKSTIHQHLTGKTRFSEDQTARTHVVSPHLDGISQSFTEAVTNMSCTDPDDQATNFHCLIQRKTDKNFILHD